MWHSIEMILSQSEWATKMRAVVFWVIFDFRWIGVGMGYAYNFEPFPFFTSDYLTLVPTRKMPSRDPPMLYMLPWQVDCGLTLYVYGVWRLGKNLGSDGGVVCSWRMGVVFSRVGVGVGGSWGLAVELEEQGLLCGCGAELAVWEECGCRPVWW